MGKRGNGEGSIYQDGRGLWRASVSLENGKGVGAFVAAAT